jgi:hypothetical protein
MPNAVKGIRWFGGSFFVFLAELLAEKRQAISM